MLFDRCRGGDACRASGTMSQLKRRTFSAAASAAAAAVADDDEDDAIEGGADRSGVEAIDADDVADAAASSAGNDRSAESAAHERVSTSGCAAGAGGNGAGLDGAPESARRIATISSSCWMSRGVSMHDNGRLYRRCAGSASSNARGTSRSVGRSTGSIEHELCRSRPRDDDDVDVVDDDEFDNEPVDAERNADGNSFSHSLSANTACDMRKY